MIGSTVYVGGRDLAPRCRAGHEPQPTPFVIPCHRVVAANGIVGFSPSVEIKEELLAMEKKVLRKLQQDSRIKPI